MSWKRFLLVQLPLALAVSAGLAEGAAWALSGVAPSRHDLDRVVAALEHAKVNVPVVVAGDSVTQDVMKTYRIVPAGVVANLTTNQASGLIGTAFLLRRYMAANAAPSHVVIASTPEFYAYQPEGVAARTYVTSVFTRADERAVLEQLGIAQPAGWRPAAVALVERVGEPLGGLVAMHQDTLPSGDAPLAAASPEPGPVLPAVAPQIAARAAMTLQLSDSARVALRHICALSAEKGFTLHLVRAPLPQSVLAARGVDGDAALRADIVAATTACRKVVVDDLNLRTSFPDYAFRDADHLRRPGWTALYAGLLSTYVGGLAIPSLSESSQ